MKIFLPAFLLALLISVSGQQLRAQAPAPAPGLVLPREVTSPPTSQPPISQPPAVGVPSRGPAVSSAVGVAVSPSGARVATPIVAPATPVVEPPVSQPPATRPPAQAPTGSTAGAVPGVGSATTPSRGPGGAPPTTAPSTGAPQPPSRGPGSAPPTTAPSTGSPTTAPPTKAPATSTATGPSNARPVQAPSTPVASNATPPVNAVPAVVRVPQAPLSAPAAGPSSSGYYNTTVRAGNATGTLSPSQADTLGQQIQTAVANNGQQVGFRVTGQQASPQSSATGRKLSQSSSLIVLDIDLVFGPCSAAEAQIIIAFLNGLALNLNGTVIINVVTVNIVNINVVNINTVTVNIIQQSGVPQLPATANVGVKSTSSASGTGGNLASQNVAGGGIVTQQGVGNTQTVNVNSGNSVTNNVVNNNIVNNNSTTINQSTSVVQTIVNQIINPTTPGTPGSPGAPGAPGPPGTPGTPGTSTPSTTPAPATPSAPATPGGASVATASTSVTALTYITQPAPTGSVPAAPPSPPPSPPPSCGSTQPQCRIYTRDMLCCQNEGILTPFQGAQVEILCTHPVRFAITCLATSGPTNISASSVYNNDYGYNYNFRTNINWLGQISGYLGKVTVDVEPARQNAARPECSLNLQTPCDYNGTLVSTMPTVQALDFSVIDFNSFYQNYVGFPPTNAIGQFSYSWKDSTYPGGCLEQPTLTIPGSFFLGAWPTQTGFAYPCNASATYTALQQTCPTINTQLVSGVTGIAPN